jgi:hypothetical protein
MSREVNVYNADATAMGFGFFLLALDIAPRIVTSIRRGNPKRWSLVVSFAAKFFKSLTHPWTHRSFPFLHL